MSRIATAANFGHAPTERPPAPVPPSHAYDSGGEFPDIGAARAIAEGVFAATRAEAQVRKLVERYGARTGLVGLSFA